MTVRPPDGGAPFRTPSIGPRSTDSPSSVPAVLRGFRAAFAFFTRLPCGGFPYSAADLAWAPAYAPIVGVVVGWPLGQLDTFLLPLGALPSAAIVIGASMLVTGAFHEDGLADTSDALGGGYDRSQILAILKDSRVGSFGAAAIAFSVLTRTLLVAQLGHASQWAIPLAFSAARVGPVCLMAALPYVTPASDAKSTSLAGARWPQAALAIFTWGIIAGVTVFMGWTSATKVGALTSAMFVIMAVTGWRYTRRLRGVTGDFLGATEQLGEVAALATLAWPA